MERVWSHSDVPARLQLNRGDIGFAQEKITAWHEMAGVPFPCYLFKLKLATNVRRAIAKEPWPEWNGRSRVGPMPPSGQFTICKKKPRIRMYSGHKPGNDLLSRDLTSYYHQLLGA